MHSSFLDYYGMTLDPFDNGSGQVFCAVAGRAERLEQALQMLEFAEMVPVLVGPPQAGKTALLKQMHQQVSEDALAVMCSVKQFVQQTASIDHWLADAFGLNGVAHAGRALVGFINDQDVAPIVLLDDAHLLDDMSLTLLTKLRQNGLRLVASRDSNQSIAQSVLPLHELALAPMDAQDATRYLTDHFQAAGVPEGIPIDNRALSKLIQASGGWPGRLNQVVRDHLISQVGKAKPTMNIPWWHLGAATAVVALIITSFAWQFKQVTPEPVVITPTPVVQASTPTPLPTLTIKQRLTQAAAELDAIQPTTVLTPTPLVTPTATPMATATPSPTPVSATTPVVEPGQYRVQFFGSWEQASAQTFIDEQTADIEFIILPTQRQGKTWYVVLSEQGYPNRAEARQALDALPQSLKALNPWAKQF